MSQETKQPVVQPETDPLDEIARKHGADPKKAAAEVQALLERSAAEQGQLRQRISWLGALGMRASGALTTYQGLVAAAEAAAKAAAAAPPVTTAS